MEDYADIAEVHARASGIRASEPLIVALLRHRRAFDPELSLVAERDGLIVGHALFSPQVIRLSGANARAVNLAPLAVDPRHQGMGVGGALMEEGHNIATAKGYELSFLLGHASYYPRFGYRTGAFGESTLTLRTAGMEEPVLHERPVDTGSLPLLQELWGDVEGDVDFSIDPGASLLDWISPNPRIRAIVYWRGSKLAGYARIDDKTPLQPRIFLARDREAAAAMAASLARQAGRSDEALLLPLHPQSVGAEAVGRPVASAWRAAMAVSLNGSRFDLYFDDVETGRRPPGRPIWPVAFDL